MKRFSYILFAGLLALGLSACDPGADFKSVSTQKIFVQNYLPQFLDILWMIDNRSPMTNNQANLISQATAFFTKLDQATFDYKMAVTSTDIEIRPGLKTPILTKGFGTLQQRATAFSNLLPALYNLQTSAKNQGFQSVLNALNGSFTPRPGVPLVIVFISDSDDSRGVANKQTVEFYRDAFLNLKGNDNDLLEVYSINYVAGGDRCATRFNADIDKPDFEDRYFQLAAQLDGQTADLCTNFSDQISLSGLQLEELKTRYFLDDNIDESTLTVDFSINGQVVSGPSYVYDATTKEIVFATPPAEGTTIIVNYFKTN